MMGKRKAEEITKEAELKKVKIEVKEEVTMSPKKINKKNKVPTEDNNTISMESRKHKNKPDKMAKTITKNGLKNKSDKKVKTVTNNDLENKSDKKIKTITNKDLENNTNFDGNFQKQHATILTNCPSDCSLDDIKAFFSQHNVEVADMAICSNPVIMLKFPEIKMYQKATMVVRHTKFNNQKLEMLKVHGDLVKLPLLEDPSGKPTYDRKGLFFTNLPESVTKEQLLDWLPDKSKVLQVVILDPDKKHTKPAAKVYFTDQAAAAETRNMGIKKLRNHDVNVYYCLDNEKGSQTSKKVNLDNLAWKTTKDTIMKHCSGARKVNIINNAMGKPSGRAQVSFKSEKEAHNFSRFNRELSIDGRRIRVALAVKSTIESKKTKKKKNKKDKKEVVKLEDKMDIDLS